MLSGERAYAYAKACGIVGKSFIGPRLSRLSGVSRPAELDRLLFPDSPLDLPERELSARLERRIAARAAQRIVRIVSSFSKPPAALLRLVRSYEYADMKTVLGAYVSGERSLPPVTDITPFTTIHWEKFPDWNRMIAGSEFSWLREPPTAKNLVDAQTELDLRYYRSLWDEILLLPRSDRRGFEELVAEEIALMNIVWALRLRTYYRIEGEDLDRRLVDVSRRGASLATDARSCAEFAVDRREDWRRWKRESLLNPEVPGEFWRVDPRWVQNAASRLLYHRATSLFRQRPFAIDAMACFIKLMQFEEDVLTSVVEGLALGMTAHDVVSMLEVSA